MTPPTTTWRTPVSWIAAANSFSAEGTGLHCRSDTTEKTRSARRNSGSITRTRVVLTLDSAAYFKVRVILQPVLTAFHRFFSGRSRHRPASIRNLPAEADHADERNRARQSRCCHRRDRVVWRPHGA